MSLSQTVTLRRRILLTLLPLLVLLAVVGSAGVALLHQLGGRIDVILRENYQSVIAMQELKEALERIDSSCQFLLVARGLSNPVDRNALEEKARQDFASNWSRYDKALVKEQVNLTIHPTEDELVHRLVELTKRYRQQGDDFFRHAALPEGARHQDYYGKPGLYATFVEIHEVAESVLQLNQHNMKKTSDAASRTALRSTVWLGMGLLVAVCLAALLAWHTIRTTLRPIQALTQAALGISSGNLDQVVPVLSNDELGQLAQAFNIMARHLREYRQSQSEQLLRAQRTSQATIDSFPDSVLVIDAQGEVEMANPAARRLLGVVPRQKDSRSGGFWQPPEALRQALANALQDRGNYLPEGFDRVILLGPNGRESAFLPRILTIRDANGSIRGAAILLQDVTRLRLLDQMKSNLVATASHELKTPLTSIRMVVHLLLEDSVGPLNPKQLELMLDARENSERLLAVVNNLLDLARLEQGWRQLEVQPVSSSSLLQFAADDIRARAQDKNIDVVLNLPDEAPVVSVDVERMGNAFRNLLDNALTYTDRGGKVTLSAAREGESVLFLVADNGCGIPAEYLPHVFEKFFRVPKQSRGHGTGLGLAIVHEIVEAHGGTITCESQPGVGTTFRIRVPVSATALASEYVEGHAAEHPQSAE